MGMIDGAGNHHHGKGTPDGGKFAAKNNSAPMSVLDGPVHPLAQRVDTLDEKIAAMQAEIASSVEDLRQDSEWQRYLHYQSMFHNYSFNNVMLIVSQRPDATRVAGLKTWNKMRRRIITGQKGISIFRPKNVKQKDKNGDDVLDDAGKPKTVCIGVSSTTVYDVSQTSGDPLPDVDMSMELSEDPPDGYTDDLEAAIRAQGYDVRYEKIAGGAYGYTRSSHGTQVVVIDENSGPGTRATTLAHELGHIMCGHLGDDRKVGSINTRCIRNRRYST